jgi:hypothetical protein
MLLALAAAAPLAAQEAASPVPDNVEAAAGDLRIIHLWTTDHEAFMQAWAGPTPPRLPTASRVERNRRITQAILYVNCEPDDAGACHLAATVTITAPDGTPYGEPLVFDAFKGPATVPRGNIGLAPNSIGLTIEDGEQLGRYRIALAVTDRNAGRTATSVVHIEAVE